MGEERTGTVEGVENGDGETLLDRGHRGPDEVGGEHLLLNLGASHKGPRGWHRRTKGNNKRRSEKQDRPVPGQATERGRCLDSRALQEPGRQVDSHRETAPAEDHQGNHHGRLPERLGSGTGGER